jgi:hypothetical protein
MRLLQQYTVLTHLCRGSSQGKSACLLNNLVAQAAHVFTEIRLCFFPVFLDALKTVDYRAFKKTLIA